MSVPRTKIRSVRSGFSSTVDQESTPPLKNAATRSGGGSGGLRTGASTSTSRSGGSPNSQSRDQARWMAWNSRWVRSIRGLTGPGSSSVPPERIAGIRQAATAASAVGSTGVSVRIQTSCTRPPIRASKESSPGASRRFATS